MKWTNAIAKKTASLWPKLLELAVQSLLVVVAVGLTFMAENCREEQAAAANSNRVWSTVLDELGRIDTAIASFDIELERYEHLLQRVLEAESDDSPVRYEMDYQLPRRIEPAGAWPVALESDHTPRLPSALLLQVAQYYEILRLYNVQFEELENVYLTFRRILEETRMRRDLRYHPINNKGIVWPVYVRVKALREMHCVIQSQTRRLRGDERWSQEIRDEAEMSGGNNALSGKKVRAPICEDVGMQIVRRRR